MWEKFINIFAVLLKIFKKVWYETNDPCIKCHCKIDGRSYGFGKVRPFCKECWDIVSNNEPYTYKKCKICNKMIWDKYVLENDICTLCDTKLKDNDNL